MESSYIQELFAGRIGGRGFGLKEEIYKFERIKRARDAACREKPGVELIDLGVGEPDRPADPLVVACLAEEAAKAENRTYADNGIPEFREAVRNYMARVYGVDGLDPATEIIHAVGSKNALSFLPACFIEPGDAVIVTVPGYPVLGTHARWYGGDVIAAPLLRENDYLPDLDAIRPEDLSRAKLLSLNYPNNPTGATVTEAFYRRIIEFARRNRIIVVQDAAYAPLVFEGRPLSFLSVPGAMDVGVELHSMSKGFNMTGWRLSWVCGNARIVRAFAAVKDNYDSGQFRAIQRAAIAALAHPEITERTAQRYSRRLERLASILRRAGFEARRPRASFYLYVPAPRGVRGGPSFPSAEDFSSYLVREKLISTVPWDDAGPHIRFSATFVARDRTDEERILDEVERRLGGLELEF